ncbi:hypothetical protein [Flavobacterium micromati]|nr:hypothetical protein [Flavobacterium micromati]
MKTIIKRIVLSGVVILLLMQLYQPVRNLDYGPVYLSILPKCIMLNQM